MRQDRANIRIFTIVSLVLALVLGWWGYQGAVRSTAKVFASVNNELVRRGEKPLTMRAAFWPNRTSQGDVEPYLKNERACASDCIAWRALPLVNKGQVIGSGVSLIFFLGFAAAWRSPNSRRSLINLDRHRIRITDPARSLPIIQTGLPFTTVGRQQWGVMRRDALRGVGRREMGSVFVFGRSGSGKSSLLKYWLTNSDKLNFVVVDLKGELWTSSAGHRRELGPVYRLDLTNMEGHALDPLDTDDEGRARAVLEVFLPTGDGGKADHFQVQAQSLALVFWRAARYTGQSAMPIIVGAATRPPVDAVALAQGLIDLAPEAVRGELLTQFQAGFGSDLWKDPEGGGGPERKSMWQTFRGAFEALKVPEILSTLSRTTFNPSSLVDQRATLYITAPTTSPPYKVPVELLMGGIVSAINTHVDTQRGGRQGEDIVLLADEAGVLRIPGLSDILATGRSRGLTVAAFFQSTAQLDTYHPRGFEGLADLSHHWVWFNTNETKTHNFLREQCGVVDKPNPSRDVDERNRRPTLEVNVYDDVRPRWSDKEVIVLLDYDRKHVLMGRFVTYRNNPAAKAAERKPLPDLPTLAAAPAIRTAPPNDHPSTASKKSPPPKRPSWGSTRMQVEDDANETF